MEKSYVYEMDTLFRNKEDNTKGYSQQCDMNVYSSVARLSTVLRAISLSEAKNWMIRQLDVVHWPPFILENESKNMSRKNSRWVRKTYGIV